MGHAVLGGTAGIVWLVLPVMTSGEAVPVAIKDGEATATNAPAHPAASPRKSQKERQKQQDETPGQELVLPLAVLGATAALAGYGSVRRTRRARTRTTPGGAPDAPEGPVAQADVPVSSVVRRVAALTAAEELLPAALADAQAELPAADETLAAVRDGVTSGDLAPVDALRRVVRACVPLGAGRTGPALVSAALLVAREAVSDVDDFVAAHEDAVDGAARTRLAEARRLLASSEPSDLVAADTLAHEARALAEQDVRRTAL
ncbi:hypothetical protein ABZ354_28335 [Streptomyces sp. NPDC005925]|uniref:hypothetical protein n=1 Tax=Streptomyces sp. NPDC005925 TaxID=3157172 RepID=UPI003404026A